MPKFLGKSLADLREKAIFLVACIELKKNYNPLSACLYIFLFVLLFVF